MSIAARGDALLHSRGGNTAGELGSSSLSLKICNQSDKTAYASVGYKKNGVWYAAGWYTVNAASCMYPRFPADKQTEVYAYATTNTSAAGSVWVPSDRVNFCIDKFNRFELPDEYCTKSYHPDLQFVEFGKLD